MTATIGDNSMPSAGPLKAFIARVERLEEDKRAAMEDIKEVYAEAKSAGFDVGVMRATVALRRQDKAKRESREALIEVYLNAIGGVDAEL
jgi:uncharacterized protein (UPF0335 family)